MTGTLSDSRGEPEFLGLCGMMPYREEANKIPIVDDGGSVSRRAEARRRLNACPTGLVS